MSHSIELKRLAKESSIYFFSSSLVSAGRFLLIPIYVKFLPPEQYGIFGLMALFGGVLSTLMTLSLHGSVSRFYFDFRDNKKELKSYISTIFYFLIGANFLVLVLLISFGSEMFKLLVKNEIITFYPYGFVVLITTYLNLFGVVPLTLFRVRQQPTLYATFEIGRFIIASSLSIYFVVYTSRLAIGLLVGELISASILSIMFFGILLIKKDLTLSFDFKKLSSSLLFSLPILPHLMLGMVIGAADKIIIERFISLKDLGIYVVGYSLGSFMNVIVTSINSACSPWFMDTAKNNSNAKIIFKEFFTKYLIIVGGICIISILYAKEIINYILPDSYNKTSMVISFILFGYLFQGLYYVVCNPLFYIKKTMYLPFISGIVALINIILNILFIQLYGIIAAAIVFALSNIIYFFLTYIISQKLYRIDYEKKILILLFIIAVSLFNTIIDDFKTRMFFNFLFLAAYIYESTLILNTKTKIL